MTFPDDDRLLAAAVRWQQVFARRVRLVLHAGTPKTGTTALQQALFRHVEELAERGIWYPPFRVDPGKKKHQFLVDVLMTTDTDALVRHFDEIVDSAPPKTHTVVLSTEGIFNHWWDYPPASRALLRALCVPFAVELWTCFREPLAFAIAQYLQLLRNPRIHAPAYGLDATLDEMLEIEWFVKRLDYLGYVLETEVLVGAHGVRLFRYGPEIVSRIFRALGAGDPANVDAGVYPSLHASGVDLMRTVNRYELSPDEQHRAAALVLELDVLIGDRATRFRAGAEAVQKIRALTDAGWRRIEPRLDAVHAPSA